MSHDSSVKLSFEIDDKFGVAKVKFETSFPSKWLEDMQTGVLAEALSNRLMNAAMELLGAQKDAAK